jgi:head-tail adaptor
MTDLTFESLLNNTFIIYRKARTFDGQGGWAESWLEAATIAGRLRPVVGRESDTADQAQRVVTHVLYTLPAVDIQRGDMVVGAGGAGHSAVLDVLGIREPSHAGHHWEIDCEEREKEPEEVTS